MRPESVPFEEVATGHSQEGRVHVHHHPHEIWTKAVGAVVEGGSEKADELKPESSWMCDGQFKMVVRRRSDSCCFERVGVLRPGSGSWRNGGDRLHSASSVVQQTDGDWAGTIVSFAGIQRTFVSSACADRIPRSRGS